MVIAVIVLVLTVFHYKGRRIKVAIVDEMQSIWTQARLPQNKLNRFDFVLYKCRTHPFVFRSASLVQEASAHCFAIAFLLCGLYVPIVIASGIISKILDVAGMVCEEGPVATERESTHPYRRQKLLENTGPMRLDVNQTKLVGRKLTDEKQPNADSLPEFWTHEVCHSTGIWLDRNNTYSIRLENTDTFRDGEIDASKGFYAVTPPSIADKLVYVLWSPLKRHFYHPWFTVIARIGGKGTTYIPLEPDPSEKYAIETSFIATHEGELFLYVNDATIGLPGLYGRVCRQHS